jgi:hypothetical protein
MVASSTAIATIWFPCEHCSKIRKVASSIETLLLSRIAESSIFPSAVEEGATLAEMDGNERDDPRDDIDMFKEGS